MQIPKKAKLFTLSLLAVGLVFIVIIASLFAYALNTSEEPARKAEVALKSFKESDHSLYQSLTESFREHIREKCDLATVLFAAENAEEDTKKYCFAKYIERNNFESVIIEKTKIFGVYETIPWTNRVSDGEKAWFLGNFKFGSNENRKNIKIDLVKLSGEWRIEGFRVVE